MRQGDVEEICKFHFVYKIASKYRSASRAFDYRKAASEGFLLSPEDMGVACTHPCRSYRFSEFSSAGPNISPRGREDFIWNLNGIHRHLSAFTLHSFDSWMYFSILNVEQRHPGSWSRTVKLPET